MGYSAISRVLGVKPEAHLFVGKKSPPIYGFAGSGARGGSGKLNGLMRRIEGYSKTDGMLILSIALAWLKLGWI